VELPLPDARKLVSTLPDAAGVKIATLSGDASASDPMPFALRAPLPGATVLHDSVTFRWEAVRWKPEEGKEEVAKSYRVEITSGKERPVQSPVVNTLQWKPGLDGSLKPGRTYTWKVFAYQDTQGQKLFQDAKGHEQTVLFPQEPLEIEFRTLDLAGRKRLQAARTSSLPLAIALAQAGLLNEAQQLLETYISAAPGDTHAQTWLMRTRQLRQEWLLKVEARLKRFPDSAGAKKMCAELGRELSER